ncbi:MAG TPA: BON domain-containing protein [Gammaproteobacteria bacterium]|nr:BON domain-containing protein [Gammaproteobacteria bacterium]
MKKIVYSLMLVLTLGFGLQGCVVLAAGAAGAATGAAVVNDRRTVKTITDDQNIEYTANSEINQSPALHQNSHIVVVSYNHAVLLVGQVPSDAVRTQVEALMQSLPKVSRIYNQLQVRQKTTAMRRSQDAWITTKVKANMLAEKGLNSGQIKVVTENGVVYLMGIVTKSQSQLASDVARRVTGVRRVVTLFEFTHG